MEEKEFVELVDRLEVYSQEHPTAYKVRVGLLAALGYLYLFCILAAILLMVGAVLVYGWINFLVIKLLLIPLGIAAVVLRSLWIKFPKPEGDELHHADAPELFELVKSLREATQGPQLHKILLTDEFNAGIVQRSRLGVFGWQENYLVIGLPLLKALSPEEVRAVIAHEFGHLSGNHGKFSGWIYRVRQTWVQILTKMKQQRGGSGLFEPFFAWYAPYFGAYSFVLARAQEYEADRCAVELSGRETAARALINLEIKARYLNEAFWPELLRQADLHPEPPAEPFSAMLDALRQPLAPNKAQLWFSQSLTRRHDYDDTHPALADRLRAMGYSRVGENAEINLFGIDNAQDSGENSFLKSPPDEFMTSRNRLWKERVAQGWRERHQFVGEAEKALAALDEKAKSEQLTVDEQWERARFLAGTKGYEAALPLLQGVLEVQSDHVGANYLLGEALLERGDEAGITHIELAMGKDISAVPEGCHLIYSFLKTHERLEEAEGYRKRVESHYDQIKRGQEERKGINVADQFLPHELPAERIEAIREQLSNIAPLRQAFLVRKVVRYFPEEPRYILGVAGKYPFYTYRSKRADRALIRLVASEVTFPGSTLIVALDQTARVLRKAIVRVDAEIYHS